MIEPGLFLTFVAAVAGLMLLPGPNVALIVANSVAYGVRYGLLTVAGTASAMVVQLGMTALGMAGLLGALGGWFGWVRWIGAAYLVWLGIAQWRGPGRALDEVRAQPKSARAIYLRALLVSLTNPKTLLFYGAFFPQFVAPVHPFAPQVAVLATTFLALALLIDGGWAVLAGRARRLLAARSRLRHRLAGGILIGAGAALAAARHT
jgi:threonine/homoserine/homoserine lactone efflux protein